MAFEKVLLTVPMGGSARKDLVQARRVLADRLYLLEVERETNPTVAALVETKRSKGDKRDLAAAIDKFAKMKKSGRRTTTLGGGFGSSARGGLQRNRRGTMGLGRRGLPLSRFTSRHLLHLLCWGTRGRRQGREYASNVWSRGTDVETPPVRRRMDDAIILNILWN
jgi:hypothetical protein